MSGTIVDVVNRYRSLSATMSSIQVCIYFFSCEMRQFFSIYWYSYFSVVSTQLTLISVLLLEFLFLPPLFFLKCNSVHFCVWFENWFLGFPSTLISLIYFSIFDPVLLQ